MMLFFDGMNQQKKKKNHIVDTLKRIKKKWEHLEFLFEILIGSVFSKWQEVLFFYNGGSDRCESY